MKNHLFFIGYMGSGKTSVARALSEKLDLPLLDMDEAISKRFDMPINKIFETFGEERFRDAETELLDEISKLDSPLIVSCGGGVPMRPENRALLKENGKTILLNATIEEIIRRLNCDSHSNENARPLLNNEIDESHIKAMIEKRKAVYEETADFSISTDGLAPEEIALNIIELMHF